MRELTEQFVSIVRRVVREEIIKTLGEIAGDDPSDDSAVTDEGHRRLNADEMRCRAPRCKRRSRGPRFHFLCREHEGVVVVGQDAA
jgi:hypothetical protein